MQTTGPDGDLGLTAPGHSFGFRTNAFPQVAVNPVNGDFYVTYDDKGSGADKADIYFTQSSNGGTSFSTPTKLNDDTATNDQWQPAISVTPDGTHVFVGCYDRRLDSSDSLIDAWAVIGSDPNPTTSHTVTFGANIRVSNQSFAAIYNQDIALGSNSSYMGDYDTAASDNNYFYYSWGDNRLTNPDVRTAKIPVAASTNLVFDANDGDGAGSMNQNDGTADAYSIARSGSTLDVTIDGKLVSSGPFATAQSITINGSTDNDSLTVDGTNGNPIPSGGITFNGGSGSNSLSITADANITQTTSGWTLSGNVAGTISVTNVSQTTLTGGPSVNTFTLNGGTVTVNPDPADEAVLYDGSIGPGFHNTFTSYPTSATFSGSGFAYTVNGSGAVIANGTSTDTANMYDTNAQATFTSAPTYAFFYGTVGGISFNDEAAGFGTVNATSSNTADVATLASSSTHSGSFFAKAKGSSSTGPYADFIGTGWLNVANGFTQITGVSNNSADIAYLDDQYYTVAGATLYEHANTASNSGPSAAFVGSGWNNLTSGFKQVVASSYNSADIAYLDDQYYTAAGASFYAHATTSSHSGPNAAFVGTGWSNTAIGFTHEIEGISYNSADSAYLDDQYYTGGGATYYAHARTGSVPTGTFTAGAAWNNIAYGFTHEIAATSYNNGDTAYLDDQGSTGTLYGHDRSVGTSFQGSGFDNVAIGFFNLIVSSYSSSDTANLYDMAGSNFIDASGSTAIFTYANNTVLKTDNFSTVNAYQASGYDTATAAARYAAYIHLFGTWH